MEKKKSFQMPHTYIIIFFVIVLAAVLTLFIPLGQYETKEITYMQNGSEKTRTVLDPDSFRYVLDENGNKVTKAAPIFGTEDFGGQGILNFVFEGMTVGDKNGTAVGIIAFILVVGGAFGIVLRTGAVESGIMKVIEKTEGREILLIPILITLFSLGGAVFGMGEEAIPFVMILVPLFIALGYDVVVGIMCSYVATQIGFGSSWMNPFSLAVAQGVAGIPVMSGAGFRIVLWVIFTATAIIFTMRYAVKIKKNPQSSVAYETDQYYRDDFSSKNKEDVPFTFGHKLVILTIVLTMAWTIWGVIAEGYYIPEIASQFFVMGLVSGIIGVVFKLNDMKVNDIAKSFDKGAAELLGAALCVGMAQGIIIILGGTSATEGTVLNTILHSIGEGMKNFPPMLSAWLMYVFQTIFNFFVVSGSGQAALTMPIMAPLADIVGVSRQVSVLAFQLGDAFSNFIVPTSGCLLGALAAARLDWGKWAKFQIKFQAVLFVFASAAMVIAVMTGFN
ncbi:putative basic amino acid antiporter YfcC [[Clostridium] symbiosum]|uniref:putative basic amino acid antiporter YfcC n=1 Tax=Clostridium symbiosum TaxID=1512 RepID=UPI00214D12BD|nr:putative basic amino acid antiporter YfcC [[Clostridium] symbiosum]MCR1942704.1 putative basic amino acid antiporter YfcC [[Clostridium] symbiosum]